MRLNLRQTRHAKNLTQAELGEKAGITKQAICKLERGQSNGSEGTWQKLSSILDTPVEQLWHREPIAQ